MSSLPTESKPAPGFEVLSPEAQALKDKCILEAGAVLARICSARAAGQVAA